MRAMSTSSNVAAETLDPPAVAGRAVRAPVVERIAPVLTGCRVTVRRRAGDLARAEELGVREMLGASRRDVDRDVAEDADAAFACVVAQRDPFALEPNLVGERVLSREGRPVAGPERVARDEVLDVVGRHARARLGEQLRRAGERRGGVVRRAGRRRQARAAAPATTTVRPPRASRRSDTPPRRGGRPAATSDAAGFHLRV